MKISCRYCGIPEDETSGVICPRRPFEDNPVHEWVNEAGELVEVDAEPITSTTEIGGGYVGIETTREEQ